MAGKEPRLVLVLTGLGSRWARCPQLCGRAGDIVSRCVHCPGD